MIPIQSHKRGYSPNQLVCKSECKLKSILNIHILTHIEYHVQPSKYEDNPIMSWWELDTVEAVVDSQTNKRTSMEIGIQSDNLG
jgi:hypothetical protein